MKVASSFQLQSTVKVHGLPKIQQSRKLGNPSHIQMAICSGAPRPEHWFKLSFRNEICSACLHYMTQGHLLLWAKPTVVI